MQRTFSLLTVDRVEEGYGVLQLVGEHISRLGRKQRVATITLGTYCGWQAERANHIVTEGSAIVGLITLRREVLEQWPGLIDLGEVWMIRALATHPDHLGRAIGAYAVDEAMKICQAGQTVYLDCVSDFLPSYYQKLGFKCIANQICEYPDSESYDITLMARQIV